MLKTLTDKDKTNWKNSLNKLIFAYNCTRTEVTGFSPFYLLYGHSPRLRVDALFNILGDADGGGNQNNISLLQEIMLTKLPRGTKETTMAK